MFCTYLHRRQGSNAVFYVGKGSAERARSTRGRSRYWRNIVAKHGHTVEVLAHWLTEAEAFDHEKFLIACFRDLRAPLCNLTDGGEGASGYVHTSEARAKIAASSKGRVASAETLAKMSARQGGRVISSEHRAKLSAARMGVGLSNQWAAGTIHSSESIAKRAAGNSAAWADPEKRAKRVEALIAGARTPEARKRKSDAAKLSWQRRKAGS